MPTSLTIMGSGGQMAAHVTAKILDTRKGLLASRAAKCLVRVTGRDRSFTAGVAFGGRSRSRKVHLNHLIVVRHRDVGKRHCTVVLSLKAHVIHLLLWIPSHRFGTS